MNKITRTKTQKGNHKNQNPRAKWNTIQLRLFFRNLILDFFWNLELEI